MSTLPSGTVTFLFSDIEGSTRLIQELGDEYLALHAQHRRLIGDAVTRAGGQVFGSEGDALFAAFESAAAAVRAAAGAQRALAARGWPCRRPRSATSRRRRRTACGRSRRTAGWTTPSASAGLPT